jgi:hypothetical protein
MTPALRGILVTALALMSMAHVGSPNTFFAGDAGPYPIRVTVRLPGVIPGLAQITVSTTGQAGDAIRAVTVQAVQWNVGPEGALFLFPATRSCTQRSSGSWRRRRIESSSRSMARRGMAPPSYL